MTDQSEWLIGGSVSFFAVAISMVYLGIISSDFAGSMKLIYGGVFTFFVSMVLAWLIDSVGTGEDTETFSSFLQGASVFLFLSAASLSLFSVWISDDPIYAKFGMTAIWSLIVGICSLFGVFLVEDKEDEESDIDES